MIAVDTNILVYTHHVRSGAAAGSLAFDAQIAALCKEAGVGALLTEDRDFDRFSGLTTERLTTT